MTELEDQARREQEVGVVANAIGYVMFGDDSSAEDGTKCREAAVRALNQLHVFRLGLMRKYLHDYALGGHE